MLCHGVVESIFEQQYNPLFSAPFFSPPVANSFITYLSQEKKTQYFQTWLTESKIGHVDSEMTKIKAVQFHVAREILS